MTLLRVRRRGVSGAVNPHAQFIGVGAMIGPRLLQRSQRGISAMVGDDFVGVPGVHGLGLPRTKKRQMRRAQRKGKSMSGLEVQAYKKSWFDMKTAFLLTAGSALRRVQDPTVRAKYATEVSKLATQYEKWFAGNIAIGKNKTSKEVQVQVGYFRKAAQKLIDKVAKAAVKEADRLGVATDIGAGDFELPEPDVEADLDVAFDDAEAAGGDPYSGSPDQAAIDAAIDNAQTGITPVTQGQSPISETPTGMPPGVFPDTDAINNSLDPIEQGGSSGMVPVTQQKTNVLLWVALGLAGAGAAYALTRD